MSIKIVGKMVSYAYTIFATVVAINVEFTIVSGIRIAAPHGVEGNRKGGNAKGERSSRALPRLVAKWSPLRRPYQPLPARRTHHSPPMGSVSVPEHSWCNPAPPCLCSAVRQSDMVQQTDSAQERTARGDTRGAEAPPFDARSSSRAKGLRLGDNFIEIPDNSRQNFRQRAVYRRTDLNQPPLISGPI